MSLNISFDEVNGHVTIADGETEIPAYFFQSRRDVKSVSIPDSVTSIGRGAFSHTSLTEVVIPDSVISIGASAFAQSHLFEVDLGSSVEYIGASAFFDNELSEIIIPDSIMSISSSSFEYNDLVQASLPAGFEENFDIEEVFSLSTQQANQEFEYTSRGRIEILDQQIEEPYSLWDMPSTSTKKKGTSGGDKLKGNNKNNEIRGKDGDDLVKGRKGDDFLTGGKGDDTLGGGAGDDFLNGNVGDDRLSGFTGSDLFHLSSGMDEIMDFNYQDGDRIGIYKDWDYSFSHEEHTVIVAQADGSTTYIHDVSEAEFNEYGSSMFVLFDNPTI